MRVEDCQGCLYFQIVRPVSGPNKDMGGHNNYFCMSYNLIKITHKRKRGKRLDRLKVCPERWVFYA